jgi:hypothetical protein
MGLEGGHWEESKQNEREGKSDAGEGKSEE